MELIKEILSINEIVLYLKTNGIKIIISILLILFYSKIKNKVISTLKNITKKLLSSNIELRTFINSIINILIQFILILFILSLFGFDFTKLAAMIGAISLVLGFAFKEVLSNFFGGLIILIFKPFLIGDLVQYSGEYGNVYKIELFYTTLITFNNEFIIMPNSNLINNEIKNINKNKARRMDLVIGVGYSSNIEEVKSTIAEIIEKEDKGLFIKDIPVLIGMTEIGASSLNFAIKVHVNPELYLDARYYLNEQIKTIFDEKNIELPYNIIDLQINGGFNEIKLVK
ncbi:mechanosensitive ion channel family protein [Oceanivirga miroungae]|uniref:Mechanosensitive ion channel protein MscS n=1 Tax=Oceanivirga miroungae TaxID=1130046 RepID=A0A6I8MAZ2_9FUSO|nr:mechanosensitive ion channel family protein [Oceanivirga miroungae]VWL85418.1 mechanosensitive ion channel protein MscS [Oceanivirga miroungae]